MLLLLGALTFGLTTFAASLTLNRERVPASTVIGLLAGYVFAAYAIANGVQVN